MKRSSYIRLGNNNSNILYYSLYNLAIGVMSIRIKLYFLSVNSDGKLNV